MPRADTSPVAVVVHQHQRVVFGNPAAVRLLVAGRAEALLGRNIADFVHPDEHPLLARRVEQVQYNAIDLPMQEWRYLRLDGSVIDVQAQATVIRLDGAPAVQVSFMDITARKQAESRLLENEARFRALTSLSSDWYWEQDAQYCFVRVPGEDAAGTASASRHHPDILYLGHKRWELGATQMTQLQWDEHRADLDAHREFRDLQMKFEFVDQVLGALERSGTDPQRLKLELTESLLADKVEDVIHKMTVLRERGVAFSLDDFGTGYSSLSYLKRLPLAHLKIDQSFVRDLLVDPNDAAIARTIVGLGASLGLAVIAEGVETQGQHQVLLEMGCETFQGYLFARPVPITEFDALLSAPLPLSP